MLIAEPSSDPMKAPEFDPNSDRNWAWPEKTWFRERLNALRAREQKPIVSPLATRKNPWPWSPKVTVTATEEQRKVS